MEKKESIRNNIAIKHGHLDWQQLLIYCLNSNKIGTLESIEDEVMEEYAQQQAKELSIEFRNKVKQKMSFLVDSTYHNDDGKQIIDQEDVANAMNDLILFIDQKNKGG